MNEKRLTIGIDDILAMDDIAADGRLILLEVKKQMVQQSTNKKENILNLEIYAFLLDYKNRIAKWLNVTELVVLKKIKTRGFTAIELQLVLTNILAEQYSNHRIEEAEG